MSNPARAAKCCAPITPRGRAAFHDAGRVLHYRVRIEDAAARLHHHEPPADAGPFDLGHHRAYVPFDRRADVGVDDGGGGALVLELLGKHVHRERDEGAGEQLAQNLPRAPLVVGIGEGVEVADRDRPDAGVPDAFGRRAHSRLVEGEEDFAPRPDPLADLEAELAGDERRRALVEGLIEVRHPHPAELEHVAEPAGGEQRGRGALALEDRIGRDRAAVQQLFERGGGRAKLFEQAPHACDDRVRIVLRRRRELAGGEPSVGGEHGDVGERSADVGGGARHGPRIGHELLLRR